MEEDGATMLKIIIDIIKLSLKVGLRCFKNIIGTATAKKYNENPDELLDAVKSAYDEVTIKRGKTHDSYMSDLFKALKTFKNKVFVDFIICHEDAWEADASNDTQEMIDLFIQKVRTKFKNMSENRLWDVVDPADAKLLALTTQLAAVEKQFAEARSGASVSGAGAFVSDSKSQVKKNQFDTRRTQYVGPHTVLDGVVYDWCDKGHKSAASPNGMYMPEGHNHEERLKKKLARRNKGAGSKSDGDSSAKQVHSTSSDDSKSI